MNTYKVLIAEDEGLIAMDIAAHLEALGHTVVGPVSTAAEAIEQARNAQVVLMDISLDGPVDGIEAASKIRERYRLPVVFLTAQADPSTFERAKRAAPFGYIVKPLAPASLYPSIEMAMHNHQIEMGLEQSETWLRAAFTSAADAVIVTDLQGQISFLNPAAETLGGRCATAVSHLLPEDPVPLAILQDATVPIQTRLAERWVEGFAAPLKACGAVVGGVLTLRDVTARRREEQRLRQQENAGMAERIASALADEFAIPIAVIRNQSEQLLRQFAEDPPVRAALEEIRRAAAAADQIPHRFAGPGRRPPGQPQVLRLDGMLWRMAKSIQSIAGDRINLALRPCAGLGNIYADPAQTEELIMELVLHAAKAMPDGGQLTIETSASGGDAALSVSHTGAPWGSDAAGLSLLRYSTPDGNRLEAFFPRWMDSGPAAATPPTLLLIEPRRCIRERLHNFFEAGGYNLLEAADDEQARTLLDLHQVDLVIGGAAEPGTVPVLRLRQPYTERQLLDQVRALLDPPLTSSAAAH